MVLNAQPNGVVISVYAWIYIPLVIGVFGITGNILTLIVVLNKSYKKNFVFRLLRSIGNR